MKYINISWKSMQKCARWCHNNYFWVDHALMDVHVSTVLFIKKWFIWFEFKKWVYAQKPTNSASFFGKKNYWLVFFFLRISLYLLIIMKILDVWEIKMRVFSMTVYHMLKSINFTHLILFVSIIPLNISNHGKSIRHNNTNLIFPYTSI